MSRRKVNSGWVYGEHSMTATAIIEGVSVAFDTLLEGQDIRFDAGAPLVGEKADYFVERLLVWGQLYYTPASLLAHSAYCHVRLGTIATEEIAFMRDALLWSEANAEFWGRILQDGQYAAYFQRPWTFDGAALAVNTAPVADGSASIIDYLGPAHFHWDIQQRFSLQRQEDRLIMALSPASQQFVDGDQYTLNITYKMLVKEYVR